MNDNFKNPEIPSQIIGKVTFPQWVNGLGIIPTSYKNSMDFYENLAWLCKFLEETVIPSVNQNGKATEELQKLYVDLKNFTVNYFDNLDVQNEVNTKLNKMVEDGTLGKLINEDLLNEINNKVDKNIKSVEYIENNTKGLSINLENHMIYDNNNSFRMQAMCVDDENRLYVYNITNNPYGKLIVFDITTKTKINEIDNIKFYHGNDMCFLNGDIYCAPIYDANNQYNNKKICIMDIVSNNVIEKDIFSNLTQFKSLSLITTYDENHIICGLQTSSIVWNELAFFMVDVRDFSYVRINKTNTNNIPLNYYSYNQICEFCNGKLFIIQNQPNTILQLDYNKETNTLNVEKMYNISDFDNLGLSIGEFEGCCKIPSNLYGNGTLLLGSEINQNQYRQFKTYKTYTINPFTNTPQYPVKRWFENTNTAAYRIFCNLNSNANTNLYEDGSTNYPFKDITRALEFVNKNNNRIAINVKSGTYYLGHQTNKKAIINIENTETVYFKDCPIFLNSCNIEFRSKQKNCLIFENLNNFWGNEINFEKSNIYFLNTILNLNNLTIKNRYYSTMHILDSNITTTNQYAINTEYSCQIFSAGNTFNTENFYYNISGFSQLFLGTETDTSKIKTSATAIVITKGTK